MYIMIILWACLIETGLHATGNVAAKVIELELQPLARRWDCDRQVTAADGPDHRPGTPSAGRSEHP